MKYIKLFAPFPILLIIILLIFFCSRDEQLLPKENIDTLAFTKAEIDTILNGTDTTAMRILTIENYDDSLKLRTVCKNVHPDSTDTVLIRLINRMYKTVIGANGVGIAAPQVGILRNIIWVQRQDKTGQPFEVYLNPKILLYTQNSINFPFDGCLSIPNPPSHTSIRYPAVLIEYDKLDGKRYQEVVDGNSSTNFTAVIFQHEIDHLYGILFIDKLAK